MSTADERSGEQPSEQRDQQGEALDPRYALDEILDGELPASAEERLRAHLGTCPECADEVERVRRIKEILRRSCTDEVAPPALRERITIEYRRVSVRVRRH